MTNDELYERAVRAINDLYSDTSVSREETADNLNNLVWEIQILLETLE